jgi:hypothetical protein
MRPTSSYNLSGNGKKYSDSYDIRNVKGNGAFTKALIEGLSCKADYNKNKKVTVKILDLYVAERVKELREANAVIFTSCRGTELSQELTAQKHGVFTYAIIQGINGAADLIKDGKISMKELDAYVSETVPKLTNGAQHPITDTPDGYANFPVAIVR